MTIVVGVRFKDSGKLYHFDPQDIPLMVGDWAVVETPRGPELGRVGSAAADLADDEVIGELKRVMRRATPNDLASLRQYDQYLDEALALCSEKVREHKLPMDMIKAEYSFDGSRLTFFFTAEKRVDFRVLVRELARTFHSRIELRQVGPRDEAKLLGGIGPCGRLLCCATFLPDFARVSIKMAKDQDLPLNPIKVSGVCGRLLCCLSYEQDQYLAIRSELPAIGDWVHTPEGPGTVVAVNVVRESVSVQFNSGAGGDYTGAQIERLTEQVAEEARQRTVQGITPASKRGAEVGAGADPDALQLLERLEDSPGAEQPRSLPRVLRPAALLTPTNDRQRSARPLRSVERAAGGRPPLEPAEPERLSDTPEGPGEESAPRAAQSQGEHREGRGREFPARRKDGKAKSPDERAGTDEQRLTSQRPNPPSGQFPRVIASRPVTPSTEPRAADEPHAGEGDRVRDAKRRNRKRRHGAS